MNLQGTFATLLVWQTLQQLLTDQLNGVDVQSISNADFNADGELIMTPPSIRVFYAGEKAGNFGDAQRLSYNAVQRYMVTCADQSLTAVLADQAMASAALADKVKNILAGARISLVGGEQSEPIAWVGTEPVEVAGVGTAYAVAIEVEGIAQFPGVNAAGYQMSSAEQSAQTVEE